MQEECPICVEPAAALVACGACGGAACRRCARRFFADRAPAELPRCLTCRHPFSREVLRAHFSAAFVQRELGGARRAAAAEADRAFDAFTLETVLPIVRRHDAALARVGALVEELRAREAALVDARRKRFDAARARALSGGARRRDAAERAALEGAVREAARGVTRVGIVLDRALAATRALRNSILREGAGTLGAGRRDASSRDASSRMLRCASDGCSDGVFRSDGDGRCLVCAAAHCVKCAAAVVPGDHTCDPASVRTLQCVLSETRGCPRCHAHIQRSEVRLPPRPRGVGAHARARVLSARVRAAQGCSQMMCVACRCVFDWVTGAEVTRGAVHNPHFLELPEPERVALLRARGDGGRVEVGSDDEEADGAVAARPLQSAEFRAALARAVTEEAPRRLALEVLRLALSARGRARSLAYAAASDAELSARPLRLRRLLGRGLGRVVRLRCAYPPESRASALVVVPPSALPGLSDAAYARALAAADTRRGTTAAAAAAAREFADAAERALRAAVAAPASASAQIADFAAAHAATARAMYARQAPGESASSRAYGLERATLLYQA